jgi:hypothetical protein
MVAAAKAKLDAAVAAGKITAPPPASNVFSRVYRKQSTAASGRRRGRAEREVAGPGRRRARPDELIAKTR